jgi:TIR domain
VLQTAELERNVDKPAASKMASPSGRRVIFISHATPQDNVFAAWLAAQLAIAGYEVWCDVTKLLGGEAWWSDIDQAIDAAAFRVLFVSTLEANRKPGTLRELRLALDAQKKHCLKDFVIPLKIDEFPFASMQESIQGLNCVRFDKTWAAGLANLLKLLEREGAPKSAAAGPGCVADWYKRSIDQNRQIVVSREQCYSNWFPLTLPKHIRFHQFRGAADSLIGLAAALRFPYTAHGEFLMTFAPLAAVEEVIGPHFSATKTCETTAFIEDGFDELAIQPFDASNTVSDLTRQAWDLAMGSRDFSFHAMASGQKAWFFKNDKLPKNRGYYEPAAGKRAFRQLVGHKTRKKIDGSRVPDGFWHYAVSASPHLIGFPRLVLKHHVIFTDDAIRLTHGAFLARLHQPSAIQTRSGRVWQCDWA